MIFHPSIGGAALNFKVVGGIEQPESPNENTIWINTDQPITGWAFNSEEPEEPYEGMVWIEVGSISNVVMNVLNENELIVRLTNAKYYHNSEWSTVGVKIYKNGEWLQPVADTLLYAYGDEAEEITGGWYASSAKTFTKAADELQFMNGYVSTVMKIDLTQFSRLEFTARNASQNATSLLGVGDTPTSFAASVQTGTSQSVMQKYILPLDELNGEYYIVMHSGSGSALTYVSKIELKSDVGDKLYLFKNGTGYTNGYQGFICVTGEPNSPDTQTDVINWSNLKSYGASVYFSPPISFEVGKYKTLNFEIRCSGRYSTENSVVIGVGGDKAKSHSECGTFDASKSGIYSEDITVYSVDVSNMSGLKYVKLGGFGVTGDIYNVWLD